ncbi:MAG: Rrf2 family transcriptional regulator [Planctomycetota bacterium]|nr:MAG: Rrf2 family transcriptional regulator [Planctomycetota bacterium]
MKVSAKTEYAALAMLELASQFPSGEPVRIRSIADEHGIPARFLVQILLQLKGAGFVTSTRGASGGYRLAKPPEDITLGEVMGVIEGQDNEIAAGLDDKGSPTARVLFDAWRTVAKVERDALHSITFADLVSRIENESENMFYI